MTHQQTITISAPAKINLGLEILRKRDDGYHEIRTVMAMIDLADTLTISAMGGAGGVHIEGMPGIAAPDNLITKAIDAFTAQSGIQTEHTVVVEKRIPSPGGIGGASSDAAATLLALNALHDTRMSASDLVHLARSLGADVPFFLGSPVALAEGTGTTLSPLPPIEGWLVLAIPKVEIRAKTPTLYKSLRPEDFTDGSSVERTAETVRRGDLPGTATLQNAFKRPLYELAPAMRNFRQMIVDSGAPGVTLSGAGPAHYVLFRSEQEARGFATRLAKSAPPDTFITLSRMLEQRPTMRISER